MRAVGGHKPQFEFCSQRLVDLAAKSVITS